MMSSVDTASSLVELGWGGACGRNFPAFRGKEMCEFAIFRPQFPFLKKNKKGID